MTANTLPNTEAILRHNVAVLQRNGMPAIAIADTLKVPAAKLAEMGVTVAKPRRSDETPKQRGINIPVALAAIEAAISSPEMVPIGEVAENLGIGRTTLSDLSQNAEFADALARLRAKNQHCCQERRKEKVTARLAYMSRLLDEHIASGHGCIGITDLCAELGLSASWLSQRCFKGNTEALALRDRIKNHNQQVRRNP